LAGDFFQPLPGWSHWCGFFVIAPLVAQIDVDGHKASVGSITVNRRTLGSLRAGSGFDLAFDLTVEWQHYITILLAYWASPD
jgi:hypothetical protein